MAQKVYFEAYIKWGMPDGQPDLARVPKEFFTIKKHWENEDNDQFESDSLMLGKHLKVAFCAADLRNAEAIFEDKFETINVERENIQIRKMDFSRGILPSIKATARFALRFKDDFDLDTLDDWQEVEENDHLYWGMTFMYLIDDWDEYEDPFMEGDLNSHRGLDVSIIDERYL